MKLAILLPLVAAMLAGQDRPVKIFISVDMEGIAGVVSNEQLGPTGFEYQRFREFMTNEVLAAIDGAKQAGATQFVVADSHGNGQNLLIEKFPNDVTIVRSFPRPLMMMEGIDNTFAGAFFIGYHSATTNPRGVRAHTISSARLAAVSLNGVAMPEQGINAAIAGEYNVPVLLVTGDDAVVEEAAALFPSVETATVKWAISFHAARTMTPAAATTLIRQKAADAVRKRASRKPYVLSAPINLDVRFKAYRPAELLAYLPMVQRTDSHSIRFTGKNMTEVSKFLEFITSYEVGLEP